MTLPDDAEVQALAGRRIVVTRAPEQSQELLDRLRDSGADALSLPLVCFLDPIDTKALDAAIAALDDYGWLVLTSANAVQFFLARCRLLGRWPNGERTKVAVVGPATRAAAESEGLQVSFTPRVFNGAALAAELAPQLRGERVLLPRSDRAEADLPAALRAAGAVVAEVAAYRTERPDRFDANLLDSICHGEVDAVIFFSPSAVREFERAAPDRSLARISERVTMAAVGPVTAKAVRETGVAVVLEASEATVASVVGALERHFMLNGAARGRS